VTERPTDEHEPPLRVALVDDHRLVLDGMRAILQLREPGIDVVVTETTWLGLLSHKEFPVEVVVLDLNLSDSIPIATKIRTLSAAGARTVVMSRHADAASVHGALTAGALAFVPKTESADEVISAVRAVARGEKYLSPTARHTLDDSRQHRDPGLGAREQRALVLYASGRSIREVAEKMSTTEETVKSYIKRARRKYRQVGVDVGTKVLLRRRGIHEGWLTRE
jgi:two-component system uhpT operon response regulator UhpA